MAEVLQISMRTVDAMLAAEEPAVTRKPIRNFHAALGAQQLQTIAGLHATLIRIPENPNHHVRENIRSLLHFEITTKMAVYGFLSPANTYELAPDCWEVSRDAELAISVRVTREEGPRYTRLLVQHRLSGHLETDYLTWPDNADEFVIQLKQPGKLDLLRIGLATSIAAGAWFLLEINFSEETVSPQSSRIQFQFGSAISDKVRFKWSAHELPRMLLAAARDTTKLSSITQISAITTAGFLSVVFGTGTVGAAIGAAVSTTLLALNAYTKNYDLGELAQKHKQAANALWVIREKYLALITDLVMGEKPIEKLQEERDALTKHLGAAYASAPPTNSNAYKKAQEALKLHEDLTFSDQEIDAFLPKELRRTAAKQPAEDKQP